MKKVLLATSILAASTGFAAAEVKVTGSARMGLIYDGSLATDNTRYTARVRVNFAMTGETDGGLAFGASVDGHNLAAAGDTATNTGLGSATVFVSGAFGKLTMGDVGTAADGLVGNVSGVGLTGLNDWNELGYLSQDKTAVKYEYSMDAFTFAASAGQTSGVNETVSIAAKYTMGDYAFALGYEDTATDDQISAGVDATFGPVVAKLRVADRDSRPDMGIAVSVDYTSGPLTVTAFAAQDNKVAAGVDAYGIGASYDLGGGAKVVGGIADANAADTVADFGLSFTF